jgi:hypothetical protein
LCFLIFRRLTNKSQTGIKMIKANGSRLDRTSFGMPFRVIVAACEVRLLLS